MKLVILASNRGSNFQAIADAVERGELPHCTIKSLITNNKAAGAIDIAQKKDIPVRIIDSKSFASRPEYDAGLFAEVESIECDLICLAGYMKLLDARFIERWEGRIINIHPSLLPSFPGLNAQKQAIEHGVVWTGCTVHFVTKEMDEGPIILQQVVRIEAGDTEETLSARLLQAEHKTYVEALSKLSTFKHRISGRKVIWDQRPKRK
jgi:phosphoribosylglycinamide formyltransferase 1